jgi:hypothetical protein
MPASQVDREVESGSDENAESYDFFAHHHIAIVRQDSPEAASIIERILEQGGAQAAMRVTFIIAVLKLEVLHKQRVPDLKSYAYMVQDYEDLRPLFEEAIHFCLKAWGLQEIAVDLEHGNRVVQIAKT